MEEVHANYICLCCILIRENSRFIFICPLKNVLSAHCIWALESYKLNRPAKATLLGQPNKPPCMRSIAILNCQAKNSSAVTVCSQKRAGLNKCILREVLMGVKL